MVWGAQFLQLLDFHNLWVLRDVFRLFLVIQVVFLGPLHWTLSCALVGMSLLLSVQWVSQRFVASSMPVLQVMLAVFPVLTLFTKPRLWTAFGVVLHVIALLLHWFIATIHQRTKLDVWVAAVLFEFWSVCVLRAA